MALVTIIVTNETGSPLAFSQLMVPNGQIAGSGQAQVTDWNYVEQILRDEELQGYITGDQALLTVNSVALAKEQSLSFLDAPTTPVKVSYGQSSSAPSTTEDESAGYSIGSVWVTTGGIPYICVDASDGAAVWTRADAAGAAPYSDEVKSDTLTSTQASAPVLMNAMSITPPAGIYEVWFSTDVYASKNNTTGAVLLYLGGSEVADSKRAFTFNSSNGDAVLTSQGKMTVNGTQAIEGRWYIESGGGGPTLFALGRSLMIVKVS